MHAIKSFVQLHKYIHINVFLFLSELFTNYFLSFALSEIDYISLYFSDMLYFPLTQIHLRFLLQYAI